MVVNIETIGSEDGHFDDKEVKVIKVISLQQSAAEIALRLKLSGMNSIVVVVDGMMNDTKKQVSSLIEAFKEKVIIEPRDAEPAQHWYPESGKKVAQWKKETYGRNRK
jgi:lipopolysaccharide biosynthesis glycosyltransferase